MEFLRVTIKTLSPVVLTAMNNATVMTDSRDYISGSVLRGVLASRYIRENNLGKTAHEDENFKKLFFGNLRFVDAYPVKKGKRSFVVPLSLQKGKIAEKNDAGEEFLLDVMQQSPKAGYKGMKGFAIATANSIESVSVRKQIKLHMSRASETERLSGRSLDGSIYNYESIEAGQRFEGHIIGEKEALELLINKLNILKEIGIEKESNQFDCRIGRSKFTEYGHCQISISEPQTIETEIASGNCIYLRLETPWIPTLRSTMFINEKDNILQKLTVINPVTAVLNSFVKDVKEKLSLDNNSVKVVKVIAKPEIISSFVGVWGMKRQEQQALMAGSIFALYKDTPWNNEELYKLQDLLYRGQGMRTEEGFGQLRIWTVENPVLIKMEDIVPEKPKAFSPLAKDIAGNILKQHILTQIRLKALEDVNQLKGNMANANHTFARLEGLLGERKNLQKAKERFQSKLSYVLREKSVLDTHLQNLRLDGTELKKFLCPEDNKPIIMPYTTIKFEEEFPDELKKLANDIGFVPPKFDDGSLFYEYWLWFFRHGRKLAIQKRGIK